MTINKKIFILALDGVPFSFLKQTIADGVMPNLQRLTGPDNFRPMHSVWPTISSTAWATFMTGRSPGRHGILGFIERRPDTMEVYIPNAAHLKGETLWAYLSRKGKKVFVMNVPCTYPPAKVNGVLICGFLGTDITKGTWPPGLGLELQRRGYRIDTDTVSAREDLEGFIAELHYVYEKRIEIAKEQYTRNDWDLFMLHVMETDRLHHFLWEQWERGHPRWAPVFMDFYRRLDRLIGWVADNLKPDTELMLLSDHGFCTLKKEVYINKWLYDEGYLKFRAGKVPDDLRDIHPASRAYSLIPGRIYINLKGRESIGSVSPGNEYEALRAELASRLAELKEPSTGEKMIGEVLRGEALSRDNIYIGYSGLKSGVAEEDKVKRPEFIEPSPVPDLLIIPRPGFDFKGNLWREQLTEKGPVVGTHTHDDAFLCIPGRRLSSDPVGLIDMMPTILDIMGMEVPEELEGRSLLTI